MRQSGQEVLATVADGILTSARRLGISETIARHIADSVDELIRLEHGGSERYIAAPDLERMKNQARLDFRTSSYKELSKKYGKSISTIRRWVD